MKYTVGGVFFSGDFSGKRTADPERSSPTYYTSINAVSAKDVPLGVSSIHLIPWGVIPHKPLIFGTSMGISSLNVYGRISAQKKRIIMLYGSKCASWQGTHCAIIKIRGWGHFRGQIDTFLQQQHPMGISSQNTLLNNF